MTTHEGVGRLETIQLARVNSLPDVSTSHSIAFDVDTTQKLLAMLDGFERVKLLISKLGVVSSEHEPDKESCDRKKRCHSRENANMDRLPINGSLLKRRDIITHVPHRWTTRCIFCQSRGWWPSPATRPPETSSCPLHQSPPLLRLPSR